MTPGHDFVGRGRRHGPAAGFDVRNVTRRHDSRTAGGVTGRRPASTFGT